jgi:hypothetical protein
VNARAEVPAAARQPQFGAESAGGLPTQLAYIRRVGRDLDHQVWPIVFNGGIVAPSDYAVHPTLGEEMKDEFS